MPTLPGLSDAFDNFDKISAESLAHWLKPVPSLVQIENYFANKILYPKTIAQTEYEMQMDLAIMRESLKLKGQNSSLNSNLYKKPEERMSHTTGFKVRVEKNIVTRVMRTLGGKGEIKVRTGQEVSPEEIIGTWTSSPGFRIINLADMLSVPPKKAGKYLVKKIKERIYKGELLALKKGGILSGKTIVTSPSDGLLELLNPTTGELKLSFLSEKKDLLSGVYGVVENIDQQRGQIEIRTEVSRIRGAFGNGAVREGILHILGKRDDLINKGAISPKYNEYILAGGSLLFKETLSAAISQGVRGFVCGGINAKDFRAIAGGGDIGISLVTSEGFGPVPMGADIFELLSSFEGKFVFIDGNRGIVNLPSFSSSCLAKVRTTILPKIENDSPASTTEVYVGSKVVIIGNSYFGQQGKVININNSPTLLPSGVKTILVTVETAKRKIQVPVANLEAI